MHLYVTFQASSTNMQAFVIMPKVVVLLKSEEKVNGSCVDLTKDEGNYKGLLYIKHNF